MNATALQRMLAKAGAVALLLAMPLCLVAAEPVDQTLDMPLDGLVRVVNLAGEVNVETWDQPRARVAVEPGKSVASVEVKATDGGIQVVVHQKENVRHKRDSKVFLRVPRRASIEVQGVSSDINVKGAEGERVGLESVSGDVLVEASVHTARLKSVSGNVEFGGSAQRVVASTVSGEIVLRGVDGEVSGNTVSGDVVVHAGRISRMAIETVSGDIEVDLALEDSGRFEGKTMSGDLDIYLPEGQEAEFSAQTFNGEIRSDFGTVDAARSGSGGILEHRDGSNDARVTAESFSGDITFRSR